jgi:hypothetical protein
MQPQQFKSLAERLLRAGVAPRHVRRYLGELRDHFDDLLRDELKREADRTTAERAAWMRLGDEELLARSVLSRADLRSVSWRFPGIVFGAGALLIWVAALALTLIAIGLLPDTSASVAEQGLSGKPLLVYALCFLFARILPVIFAIGMLAAAARQRLVSRWPVVGAAVLAVLGGTTTISLALATGGGEKAHVMMSQSLLPFLLPFPDAFGPKDLPALAGGFARGTLMLVASLLPYMLWRRRQRMLVVVE